MCDWLVAVILRSAAHDKLCDLGFLCYRPMYRVRIVRRGRRVYDERPLFGRYLLVELLPDFPEQYHKIIAVRYVAGILVKNERPCAVPEADIVRLRGMERNGYVITPKRMRFVPGQQVAIRSGPFTNHDAVYAREAGDTDFVTITLFGAQREIGLPMGHVAGI